MPGVATLPPVAVLEPAVAAQAPSLGASVLGAWPAASALISRHAPDAEVVPAGFRCHVVSRRRLHSLEFGAERAICSETLTLGVPLDPGTCHHEAGHAVLAYALGFGADEVVVRDDGSGEFMSRKTWRQLIGMEAAVADAVVIAAGPVAHRKFCDLTEWPYVDGSSGDVQIIREIADEIERDPRALLTLAWRLAGRALNDPTMWRAVEWLAAALARSPMLRGLEAHEIMRGEGVFPGYFGWTARPNADEDDDAADAEEEAADDAMLAYEEQPLEPREPVDENEPF